MQPVSLNYCFHAWYLKRRCLCNVRLQTKEMATFTWNCFLNYIILPFTHMQHAQLFQSVLTLFNEKLIAVCSDGNKGYNRKTTKDTAQ